MTVGTPRDQSYSVSQAQCASTAVTVPADLDKPHRCPSTASTAVTSVAIFVNELQVLWFKILRFIKVPHVHK